jgi:serine/threonine protein kinase
MEAPVITDTVSHYTVLKKLGAGGRGEVYLAEDTVLNRRVAIKFLPDDSAADQQAKRRFIREAQAAARLDHPNICTIHEVGEEAGRGFIVMEYLGRRDAPAQVDDD